MRYLSKRDDFLRNSKINEKNDFIRKSKSGLNAYELITEDGGPFYNEVGWNDSLLGRLINHLIRKAKVALGKSRIKPVLSRLYAEFDRIVAEGVLAKAEGNVRLDVFRLVVCEYIATLKKAIEDGDDHLEILGVTNETIYFLKDLDFDFDEKEQILLELEELKKLLETFGGTPKTTDDEKEEEEVEEDEEEEEQTSEIDSLYPLMIENLKALSLIIKTSQNIKNTDSKNLANKTNVESKPLTNAPDIITQIADSFIFEANIDPKKEIEDLKDALEQAKKNPKANKDQIDMLTVSIKNKEKQLGNTKSIPNPPPLPPDSNIKKGIDKLNQSIKNLIDPKIKIAVSAQLIDAILAQGDQYKDEIIKLYTEINSFLFGIKAKTLNYEPNKLNELYKGPGKNLIGNNVDAIAEKIAKFYKRSTQFEEGNLFTKIGEIGTPLKSFVETMKKIVSVKVVAKPIIKDTEPSKTTERRLMSYDSFFKINELLDPDTEREIEASDRERDEKKETDAKNIPNSDKSGEPGEVATGSISEKITDFWERKCKTTRSYVIDKTEADKIKANFEKIQGNTDNFVIDGLDPVINIIRLFNRAYKIFTVATITKRSNGKVDPSTFGEYTSYGGRHSGGDLNGWSGPFRNNKIFNIWEDGVLKILGDPKYQYIFDKTTKLRMPKVSNPSKIEDYEFRENAGANLRRFMTDILDGEELYKISGGSSTDKGTQAKFLEKYFGEPDEKTKGELGTETSFAIDGEDGASNSENATKIGENSLKLKFKKAPNKEFKTNQFFAINCKVIDENGNESKPTYRFFQLSEVGKNGFSYLSMCNSFFFFEDYLKSAPNKDEKDARKKVIDKGDMQLLVNQSKFTTEDKKFKSYYMKYTNIKNEFINSLFVSGSKFEITYITNDKKSKTEKIKVIDSYWLVEVVGDKVEIYTANLTQEYLNKKIQGENNNVKNVSVFVKNNLNQTSIKKI